MKDLSVFDTNFNTSKLSSYTLMILLSNSSLSYSIVDPIRKIYLAQVHYNLNPDISLIDSVKNIFEQDKYLTKKYKQVKLILQNPEFILIPEEFFDKNKINEIFKINFEISPTQEVHFNKVKTGIYVLFSIDNPLLTFLIEKIPEITFYSHASVLINYALSNKRSAINIFANYLDIAKTDVERILNVRSFQIADITDAAYIILKMFENDKDAPITIFGDFEQNTEIIKILKANLSDCQIFQNYYLNYNMPLPKHYFTLLNLAYSVE